MLGTNKLLAANEFSGIESNNKSIEKLIKLKTAKLSKS